MGLCLVVGAMSSLWGFGLVVVWRAPGLVVGALSSLWVFGLVVGSWYSSF